MLQNGEQVLRGEYFCKTWHTLASDFSTIIYSTQQSSLTLEQNWGKHEWRFINRIKNECIAWQNNMFWQTPDQNVDF